MSLKTYVRDNLNRIVIGGAAGIGLIITAVVGLSGDTPAGQVRDSNDQVTYEVQIDGDVRSSGGYVTRKSITGSTLYGADLTLTRRGSASILHASQQLR